MEEIRTDQKFIARQAFGKSKKGRLCAATEAGLIFGLLAGFIFYFIFSLFHNSLVPATSSVIREQEASLLSSLFQTFLILLVATILIVAFIGYSNGFPFFLRLFFKPEKKDIEDYVQKRIDQLTADRLGKEAKVIYLRKRSAREIKEIEADIKDTEADILTADSIIEKLRSEYLK